MTGEALNSQLASPLKVPGRTERASLHEQTSGFLSPLQARVYHGINNISMGWTMPSTLLKPTVFSLWLLFWSTLTLLPLPAVKAVASRTGCLGTLESKMLESDVGRGETSFQSLLPVSSNSSGQFTCESLAGDVHPG